jgi:hypothetical protein
MVRWPSAGPAFGGGLPAGAARDRVAGSEAQRRAGGFHRHRARGRGGGARCGAGGRFLLDRIAARHPRSALDRGQCRDRQARRQAGGRRHQRGAGARRASDDCDGDRPQMVWRGGLSRRRAPARRVRSRPGAEQVCAGGGARQQSVDRGRRAVGLARATCSPRSGVEHGGRPRHRPDFIDAPFNVGVMPATCWPRPPDNAAGEMPAWKRDSLARRSCRTHRPAGRAS